MRKVVLKPIIARRPIAIDSKAPSKVAAHKTRYTSTGSSSAHALMSSGAVALHTSQLPLNGVVARRKPGPEVPTGPNGSIKLGSRQPYMQCAAVSWHCNARVRNKLKAIRQYRSPLARRE
jgi:hypothetical protein